MERRGDHSRDLPGQSSIQHRVSETRLTWGVRSFFTGIEFLTDLHTHFGGDTITLIWDNLPCHKSKAMTAGIAGQRHWFTVERLPGYAHDLDPIEMVRGNIKTVELANLCPDTIDEAHAAAESGLNRVGSNYELCFAFLAHTGPSL